MIGLFLRLTPISWVVLAIGVAALLQSQGVDLTGMALDALGLGDPFGWF